jgi:hypothetical protein
LWLPEHHSLFFVNTLATLALLTTGGCSQDAQLPTPAQHAVRQDRIDDPRKFSSGNLTIWWDRVPESVRELSHTVDQASAHDSNIRPADYVGPDACRTCHPKQHGRWSKHPHRFMNAMAINPNVQGDFSGPATEPPFFSRDNQPSNDSNSCSLQDRPLTTPHPPQSTS